MVISDLPPEPSSSLLFFIRPASFSSFPPHLHGQDFDASFGSSGGRGALQLDSQLKAVRELARSGQKARGPPDPARCYEWREGGRGGGSAGRGGHPFLAELWLEAGVRNESNRSRRAQIPVEPLSFETPSPAAAAAAGGLPGGYRMRRVVATPPGGNSASASLNTSGRALQLPGPAELAQQQQRLAAALSTAAAADDVAVLRGEDSVTFVVPPPPVQQAAAVAGGPAAVGGAGAAAAAATCSWIRV